MATQNQKPQTMSKGDKLRAALKKHAKKDNNFMQITEGNNVIRVLPEVGNMEFFFQAVGVHHLDDKTRVYCPHIVSDGELPCPICEIVDQQYKFGDKELASQWRVEKKFWMNVISREASGDGPKILTAGTTIFQPIIALLSDPDNEDIFDVKTGIDLVISRTGKGKNDTKYGVTPKLKKTPLHTDPNQIKEWMKAAKDLSWIEVTDDPEDDMELTKGKTIWVLPYDRIVREYELDTDAEEIVEGDDGFEEFGEDLDDEDETDGEFEDLDDDDDEDYVEPEPAPKSVKRIQKPAPAPLTRKRTR